MVGGEAIETAPPKVHGDWMPGHPGAGALLPPRRTGFYLLPPVGVRVTFFRPTHRDRVKHDPRRRLGRGKNGLCRRSCRLRCSNDHVLEGADHNRTPTVLAGVMGSRAGIHPSTLLGASRRPERACVARQGGEGTEHLWGRGGRGYRDGRGGGRRARSEIRRGGLGRRGDAGGGEATGLIPSPLVIFSFIFITSVTMIN